MGCTTRRLCAAGTASGPLGELGGRNSSAAIRTLDQLPVRITPAVVEFVYGPLAENPDRVGKPLRGDFTGVHSARRGSYRVLYEINEIEHSITVVRVTSRADAYRPR